MRFVSDKTRINYQVPSQGPHKLMRQIYSIRHPRGFTRNITSIIPVIYPNKEPRKAPLFGDSSGDLSGSSSDKITKYPSLVLITNSPSVPSKTSTKDYSHVPK